VFDVYQQNRATGGLILINENTFDTVGAGMLHVPKQEENLQTEFAI
jgi:sulfate adenylyltransferase subunit 1 (EFTu-like GTPase family)